MTDPTAIVLLSGGLDSVTTLAIARAAGRTCYALSFRYGQRHEHELVLARRLATTLGAARHLVVDIDLAQFGGSALTANIDVPKDRPIESMSGDIPITYVPARNTVFLSYALAFAEVTGAEEIYLGVNAVDYSGYPDCRPEFIDAFEKMANLATKAAVEGRHLSIQAPLLLLTKAEIITRGLELGVDYGSTSTCYDPDAAGAACGRCDACALRLRAFADLGLRDPAPYQGAAS